MDVLRPVNGVYQCVNNPANTKKYVLREIKGYYPVLVPLEDADCEKKIKEITRCYPIPILTKEDCSGKARVKWGGLLLWLKRVVRQLLH